jgi:hypothetical protein
MSSAYGKGMTYIPGGSNCPSTPLSSNCGRIAAKVGMTFLLGLNRAKAMRFFFFILFSKALKALVEFGYGWWREAARSATSSLKLALRPATTHEVKRIDKIGMLEVFVKVQFSKGLEANNLDARFLTKRS